MDRESHATTPPSAARSAQPDEPGTIVRARVAAEVDAAEFVVFLIGMRINRLWKVHKWLPVARAMGSMLRELHQAGNLGLRHVESWFGRTSIMVQYWDSFEALEAYATGKSLAHLPAWAAFNRAVGSNGDVGIWHETYRVRPGDFECVYNNMPRFGLARAFESVPASGAYGRAASRLRQAQRAREVA
ncbi:MAG: DUF4188 domain-containing protein [Pseudomonadales bacterium]